MTACVGFHISRSVCRGWLGVRLCECVREVWLALWGKVPCVCVSTIGWGVVGLEACACS